MKTPIDDGIFSTVSRSSRFLLVLVGYDIFPRYIEVLAKVKLPIR
jgi:hypothetical protein